MHREAQEHPLNGVLGALEMSEMINSPNFTVANVARINQACAFALENLGCACWEVLAQRAVRSDVRKQKAVPV